MANRSIIDKNGLGKTVLELSLSHTINDTIEILAKTHNVKVSYKTIQRYIEGFREERREQTKAVINEHIKVTMPTDLERLDKVIKSLNDRFDNADTDRDAATLANPLLKAIDMKFDYSGAKTSEVTVNLDGWRDEVRSRISRIASRDGASGDPQ